MDLGILRPLEPSTPGNSDVKAKEAGRPGKAFSLFLSQNDRNWGKRINKNKNEASTGFRAVEKEKNAESGGCDSVKITSKKS